jgi:predicted unusual protein kinase regulating ubiquinone biosynthesis (AarF/ABC1/UbiB family)
MIRLNHPRQRIIHLACRTVLKKNPRPRLYCSKHQGGILSRWVPPPPTLLVGGFVVGTSLAERLSSSCEAQSAEAFSSSKPQQVLSVDNTKWTSRRVLQQIRRGWRMLLRILKLALLLAPVAAFYPVFLLLPQPGCMANEDVRDILLSSSEIDDDSLAATWRRMYFKLSLACVEKSGAAVVKLLQWAGSRPDLFGHEFCAVFSKLQDNTTPHSWKYTDRAMRQAYGEDWQEKIKLGEIVGSGCIGQVYRGRIQGEENREVAVKILHPSVEDGIEADLDLIRFVAYSVTLLQGRSSWLDWPGLAEEFARLLRLQVDLRHEARNLVKFAHNFKDWKDLVIFPHLIPEFAPDKNVLVESFLDGIPVLQFARANRENEEQLHDLCLAGIKAVCKMIFLDNFVHGTYFPANTCACCHSLP